HRKTTFRFYDVVQSEEQRSRSYGLSHRSVAAAQFPVHPPRYVCAAHATRSNGNVPAGEMASGRGYQPLRGTRRRLAVPADAKISRGRADELAQNRTFAHGDSTPVGGVTLCLALRTGWNLAGRHSARTVPQPPVPSPA